MPDTPEDIPALSEVEGLSEAIAQQERDRLKAVAKREKMDRRRQPYTSYYGTDGATGQVRVKALGSEGVLGVRSLSNVQPSMGQYGRGFGVGFDAGNVRKPEIQVLGKKVGEVTVLATKVVGANTEVYLGGDRSPTLIGTIPNLTLNHISLELIGPAKNDWIVAIRYGNTIQMIFGGHTGTTPLNWEITDPRCLFLRYGGMGFWRSNSPVFANTANFANTQIVPGPDLTTLVSQLPPLVRTGEHSGIEGLSTISVAYFENSALPSPSSISGQSSNVRNGIVQIPGFPFVFSGVNADSSVIDASVAYEGVAQGPGYMGPGGLVALLSDPSIFSTELLPRRVASDSRTLSRALQTQTVSLSAINGVISENIGTHTVNGSAIYSTTLFRNQTPRRNEFVGSPQQFSSPNAVRWTIFSTTAEFWPSSPIQTTITDNGLTIALNNPLPIAPAINKNYTVTASSPFAEQTNGSGISKFPTPGLNFEGGFTWGEVSRSGAASLDYINGNIDRWNVGVVPETRYWLSWSGTDIETDELLNDINRTLQPDPTNSVFPRFNKAIVPDTQKLFRDGGIQKAEITPYTGAIVGGKLAYQAEDKVQKKVLSMSALGITAQVRMAKYWANP